VPKYICETCGVQFANSNKAPMYCPICEDERQYIPITGQSWTSLKEMSLKYQNEFRKLESNLMGIATNPNFAIGQRAILLQTKHGNILWDCISYIDDETIQGLEKLGGISAIAISHPHFYSSMVEWSKAFNNAPIYLHASNEKYVMQASPAIKYWDGNSKKLNDEVSLIRCGGHFTGSTVMHYSSAADGNGAIFTGDTITVVQDMRYVSFMRSYPNYIPLNAKSVKNIVTALEPYKFDKIYGGWWNKVVKNDGKSVVSRSAERYIKAIS